MFKSWPLIFKKTTQPIIVGGFYRSGTTLTRRLLDSHSQIFCGPEVKFWRDFYGDYLNDDLAHIRFFSTARSLKPSEHEFQSLFAGAYVKLLENTARAQGKKRWADKNPENLLYLNQWNETLQGKFQFVFVVRNPLDTLASLEEAGFYKTIPKDFTTRVTQYIAYMNAGLKFSQENPGRSFILRYEALASEPEKTLQSLFEFLNLKFEKQVINNFHLSARNQGIEDPKVNQTRAIHQHSIDRWRRDLSKEQITIFCTHMESLMQKLAYDMPNICDVD